MRITTSFLFLVFTIIACEESGLKVKPSQTTPKNYEQFLDLYLSTHTPIQPTFLEFKLGSSRKQTKKHIDSLIKAGKLGERTSVTYQTLNLSVSGYNYDLQLNSKDKIEFLLDVNFDENDKLYSIAMLPKFARDGLVDFLLTQYGTPAYTAIHDPTAQSDSTSSDKTIFWFHNGYEISYIDTPFGTLDFSDPNHKKLELTIRHKHDSTEQILSNKKAKAAKQDFK